MPQWTHVLCDSEGGALGDISSAQEVEMSWVRNQTVEVQVTLDLDDPRAADIDRVLADEGFPRIKCYLDGQIMVNAVWAPHEESASGDDQPGELRALFRGPLSLYGRRYSGPSVTFAGESAVGADGGLGTYRNSIAAALIRGANAAGGPCLRVGTLPVLGATTVHTIEHKELGEAINELADADDSVNGFEFYESPVDDQPDVELYRNQITNPSFETSATAGWSTFATVGYDGAGPATPVRATSTGYSWNGDQSLLLTASGTMSLGGIVGVRHSGLTVVADRFYSATVRCYVNDYRLQAGLRVTDELGSPADTALTPAGKAGDFELSVDVRDINTGGTDWRLELFSYVGASDGPLSPEVYFDSVVFCEVEEHGERPYLFDGDSPDCEWEGTAHASSSVFFERGQNVMAMFDTYETFGEDRSETAVFEYGPGTRENALDVTVQSLPPINQIRVLGEAGVFAEARDQESIEKYGLCMSIIPATNVNPQGGTHIAPRAHTVLRPDPVRTVTVQPNHEDLTVRPIDDYFIGDTITVRARRGAMQIDDMARVNGLKIVTDGVGRELKHEIVYEAAAS